ncbi:MAG TPA: hypothetical protein VMQ83_09230 [Gammaproteobacteria bacterium]|nr:hypothetical protein [Gammaproteobacteria bacterium]
MSLLLALPMLPLAVAAWLARSSRTDLPGAGWIVALVAALPVAVAALAAGERLALPDLLVLGNSALVLDETSRAALLLFGGLWVTAGLLLTRHDDVPGAGAAALLVGLSGAVTLALAEGGPLVYAGLLATGYGLYAVMAGEPGDAWRRAGRTMVVLLVVSDLLVFEVLLSQAAHPAAALGPGLLALVIVAMALRGGVPPAHAWLPPALAAVRPPTAMLLVAVPPGAALFGFLKMFPGGLPEVAAACILLGSAGAVWMLFAGLARSRPRTTLGYALGATAALLLSAASTGAGPGAGLAWLGVALLACCAALPLVALLRPGSARDTAIAVALGVHGLAGGLAALHAAAVLPRWGAWLAPVGALIATLLLTVTARRTPAAAADGTGEGTTRLVFAPLALAAAALGLAWGTRVPGFDALWLAPVAVTLGLVAYRVLPRRRRPHVPRGDLPGPVERGVGVLASALHAACMRDLPRLRDRLIASLLGLWDGEAWSRRILYLDLRLRAWPATSLMLLLFALGAAWLLAA